jgi:hypothetical protein
MPLPDAVAHKIDVPTGLAVAHVYAPASVAKLDVSPDDLIVEAPRDPRPGRSSVRVSLGKQTVWVQIQLVAAGDADAPAADPHAQVVARGTKITVAIHSGSLVVHATAVLEAAARVGEQAQLRISATRTLVRGTLVTADSAEVAP